ncbi:hypothetical protein TSH7_10055 [Azospirillum sp. TSH7]|uniref:hypothetical protein n=1 Tax=unclassified Azospirillum TaxID=2630922 RepID=UPI000D60D1E4|nr:MULTISPECIES: hypothetical protein [unclassified Azospirillum]PWC64011.1 hypothetical protein TSH20_19150 [Azospirillum sp. TSH20]PWC64874.1 hypothetical protein TSH7_10055 [Azospirillum sp. TSH7]
MTDAELAARLRQAITDREAVRLKYTHGLVEPDMATRLYRCVDIPPLYKIVRTPGNTLSGWGKPRVTWFLEGRELREFKTPGDACAFLEMIAGAASAQPAEPTEDGAEQAA